MVAIPKAGVTPPSTYVVADTLSELLSNVSSLIEASSGAAAAASRGCAGVRSAVAEALAARVREEMGQDAGSGGCGPRVRQRGWSRISGACGARVTPGFCLYRQISIVTRIPVAPTPRAPPQRRATASLRVASRFPSSEEISRDGMTPSLHACSPIHSPHVCPLPRRSSRDHACSRLSCASVSTLPPGHTSINMRASATPGIEPGISCVASWISPDASCIISVLFRNERVVPLCSASSRALMSGVLSLARACLPCFYAARCLSMHVS